MGFCFHFSSLYPAQYIVLAYLNFIFEFQSSFSAAFFFKFSSLFKKRTVTTDRHFLLQCIHTNKFILYSGSQSYMAASFSTKESPKTRRRVVGGPFNGRPLPEQFVLRPSISGKCEHGRSLTTVVRVGYSYTPQSGYFRCGIERSLSRPTVIILLSTQVEY